MKIKEDSNAPPVGRIPSEAGDEDALGRDEKEDTKIPGELNEGSSTKRDPSSERRKQPLPTSGENQDEIRRVPSRVDKPFEKWEREEMEVLLNELCGHLGNAVVFLSETLTLIIEKFYIQPVS